MTTHVTGAYNNRIAEGSFSLEGSLLLFDEGEPLKKMMVYGTEKQIRVREDELISRGYQRRVAPLNAMQYCIEKDTWPSATQADWFKLEWDDESSDIVE